ncbi:MAG: pyruvate kinase, partial [Canidatus Methanoxibalbensis ujae]|nr:pyruvate kinase [Candidatus Methanoxibalbensis ujae]
LGTMISPKKLGYWQDKTVEIAKRLKKPILIAGQVFHHLTRNRQPTRSEVVHFYYLRKHKVDGIVLSDETAIGIDPVNALREVFALL